MSDMDLLTPDITEVKTKKVETICRNVEFSRVIWEEMGNEAYRRGLTREEYLQVLHNTEMDRKESDEIHAAQNKAVSETLLRYRALLKSNGIDPEKQV